MVYSQYLIFISRSTYHLFICKRRLNFDVLQIIIKFITLSRLFTLQHQHIFYINATYLKVWIHFVVDFLWANSEAMNRTDNNNNNNSSSDGRPPNGLQEKLCICILCRRSFASIGAAHLHGIMDHGGAVAFVEWERTRWLEQWKFRKMCIKVFVWFNSVFFFFLSSFFGPYIYLSQINDFRNIKKYSKINGR